MRMTILASTRVPHPHPHLQPNASGPRALGLPRAMHQSHVVFPLDRGCRRWPHLWQAWSRLSPRKGCRRHQWLQSCPWDSHKTLWRGQSLLFVTIRTYRTNFYLFTRCTDTGVIVTHALSFYRPLAPLFSLTHVQLAVVTQSCTLLYTAAHCDLLSQ